MIDHSNWESNSSEIMNNRGKNIFPLSFYWDIMWIMSCNGHNKLLVKTNPAVTCSCINVMHQTMKCMAAAAGPKTSCLNDFTASPTAETETVKWVVPEFIATLQKALKCSEEVVKALCGFTAFNKQAAERGRTLRGGISLEQSGFFQLFFTF